MTRWGFAALILFAAACGDDGGSTGTVDAKGGGGNHDGGGSGSNIDAQGGVGEPPGLVGITLYHNQVRAMVDTPTPLPALQWDPDLAAYAAAYVAACPDTDAPIGLVDHNPNRSGIAGYSYIGENIFGSGGAASAQQAVELWASEGADYNYANNSCGGNTCGHYTQIVWRTTTHVGCALHDCPGLQYGSTVICDYGPGGNNGNLPY